MTLFLAAGLLLGPLPAAPAAAGVSPEMDRLIMRGLDHIYRMEFDEAEEASRKIVALDPEHPYGYFALASTEWTRYVYETEQTDQSLLKPIEEKMGMAIEKSDRWLKKRPNDATVLMVEGSAYGLMSRLLCLRREWLKAYWYGRKAVRLTRAAVKADPELYDAYLGIGMYDYYTDIYQKLVGVLAKVLFGGSRERGIKTLRMVAEKGRYSKTAAQLILVEIYNMDLFGSADPAEAVRIMKDVRKRYPDSPMLFAAELVSLYESKHYEETAAGGAAYLKLVDKGKYPPIERARAGVIHGTALWALQRKDKGLESLKLASNVKVNDQLSRWSVWALIRAAELEDQLGMREAALKDYRTAAKQPDHWGLRSLAKAGLSKPFKADTPPGPIQTPD